MRRYPCRHFCLVAIFTLIGLWWEVMGEQEVAAGAEGEGAPNPPNESSCLEPKRSKRQNKFLFSQTNRMSHRMSKQIVRCYKSKNTHSYTQAEIKSIKLN